jgi:hypothetical protein
VLDADQLNGILLEPLIERNPMTSPEQACGSSAHFSRRTLLRRAGLSGIAWLTPISRILAREAEKAPSGKPARSVIILWMAGGPSQLETFDPHPGSRIAAGSGAVRTAVNGVKIGDAFAHLPGLMQDITLVRSVVSKEADHERAVYNMKTGYRPVPTVVHPAIGAIVCHELGDPGMDIPRHISILPEQWPARGGYFGAEFDAFQVFDPMQPVQDVRAQVPRSRMDQRVHDLDVVERGFGAGRRVDAAGETTPHRQTVGRALRMMTSAQLGAFDVRRAPASQRSAYGDSPFGRGCLAALRLVETGVRCVEVTLGGWDTHANNHELQRKRVGVLDPAFAALIRDLKERGLFESTLVLCGGEFGRSPKLNPLGGRDHWPYGFSVALAGGGIRGGQVLGATDPGGESRSPKDPVAVQDIHATIQTALGINPDKEIVTPVGRPIALSDGRVIRGLLKG